MGRQAQVDAFAAQPLGQQRPRLGLLPGQQRRLRPQQGHARAEPREPLRQLAADRAAAQHQQPLGQLLQVPDGVAGQRAGLPQAGQLGQQRPGARRQQRHAPADLEATVAVAGVDQQPARSGKARMPLGHVHPGGPQPLRRILRRDPRLRRAHVAHDPTNIDLGLDRDQAHPVRAAHPLGQVGRGEQALARHAAGPQALPTDPRPLHQAHPRAGPRPDQRGDQPGGPTTDHRQVVAPHPQPSLPGRLAPTVAAAASQTEPAVSASRHDHSCRAASSTPRTNVG
jgi:hypothetical protein